jgi:hypothetical protein
MQRLGFIHDMLDVKVLILFVMALVSYPVNIQQIYELSYQDDCLSYFDVCTAVPEMVKSGHLKELENEQYEITEKGKADGALTEDSIRSAKTGEHLIEIHDLIRGIRCARLLTVTEGGVCDPNLLRHIERNSPVVEGYLRYLVVGVDISV